MWPRAALIRRKSGDATRKELQETLHLQIKRRSAVLFITVNQTISTTLFSFLASGRVRLFAPVVRLCVTSRLIGLVTRVSPTRFLETQLQDGSWSFWVNKKTRSSTKAQPFVGEGQGFSVFNPLGSKLWIYRYLGLILSAATYNQALWRTDWRRCVPTDREQNWKMMDFFFCKNESTTLWNMNLKLLF